MDKTQNIPENLPSSIAEMTDILDIEPAYLPPADFFWWIVLGVVAFLFLLWLVIKLAVYLKSRRQLGEEVLSPSTKALKELERLKQQRFLEQGEVRKHYFFASEILRRFLEEEHGYNALEKTTPEITKDWESTDFEFDKQAILSLLNEADRVKFSNQVYPMEKMGNLVSEIQQLIRQSLKKKST